MHIRGASVGVLCGAAQVADPLGEAMATNMLDTFKFHMFNTEVTNVVTGTKNPPCHGIDRCTVVVLLLTTMISYPTV